MSALIHTPFQPNTEGLFIIPAETYHNHVEAPEVSRSLIVEMVNKSPAHVRAMIDGSSKKKETKAMVSGTLVDLALLEPDRFKEGVSHWTRPEGLSLITKEGIQWKKDHPDLPYLQQSTDNPNEASVEDIQGMIAAVMRHKIARKIVERSVKQEAAFCHDPATGLLRKCRTDARLDDDSGRLTLADLKSTFYGGTAKHVFKKHVQDMGYDIQSPFYSDIYRDLLGADPFFIFFVVERKPPYAVRTFQIDATSEGAIEAREEMKKAMAKFAECKASRIWSGYEEKIEQVQLPKRFKYKTK